MLAELCLGTTPGRDPSIWRCFQLAAHRLTVIASWENGKVVALLILGIEISIEKACP